MRFILDANAMIYLAKAHLFEMFMKLIKNNDLVIDNNVYNEVVERGIENRYADAYLAKDFLETFRIPVISVDISSDLQKFRDPGETSCYLLAEEDGICITSDIRATKKFENHNIEYMELDLFFFQQFLKKNIGKLEFIKILNDLKRVNGTTANRISVFLEVISKGSDDNE